MTFCGNQQDYPHLLILFTENWFRDLGRYIIPPCVCSYLLRLQVEQGARTKVWSRPACQSRCHWQLVPFPVGLWCHWQQIARNCRWRKLLLQYRNFKSKTSPSRLTQLISVAWNFSAARCFNESMQDIIWYHTTYQRKAKMSSLHQCDSYSSGNMRVSWMFGNIRLLPQENSAYYTS